MDEEQTPTLVVILPYCSLLNSTGLLTLHRSDTGEFFGYVSKYLSGVWSKWTTDVNEALIVTLPSSRPYDTLIDLNHINGEDQNHMTLGGIGGPGGYAFGVGRFEWVEWLARSTKLRLDLCGVTDTQTGPFLITVDSYALMGFTGHCERTCCFRSSTTGVRNLTKDVLYI